MQMTRWLRGHVLALAAITAMLALPPPQAEAIQPARDTIENDPHAMPATPAQGVAQGQLFAFAVASAPVMPRASPARSVDDSARNLNRPSSPISLADDTVSSRTADRS